MWLCFCLLNGISFLLKIMQRLISNKQIVLQWLDRKLTCFYYSIYFSKCPQLKVKREILVEWLFWGKHSKVWGATADSEVRLWSYFLTHLNFVFFNRKMMIMGLFWRQDDNLCENSLQTEVLNCLLNKTFMFSREDKTVGV